MIPSAARRACSTGATEIKRDMRTVCLIDCVFALDLPLAEPRKICCHLCGMSGFAAKAQNKFPSEKGGSLMSPVSLGRFNTIPNSLDHFAPACDLSGGDVLVCGRRI